MGALGRNFAIQGELIGPKVQGNLYELPERDFRMYLAYDIDEKRYFTLSELKDLANELQIIGVPLLDENHIVHTDTKAYVDLSIGNSKLNSKKKREGIVIRLAEENYSFKSINPEYLLGQKDEFYRILKNYMSFLVKNKVYSQIIDLSMDILRLL